MTATRTQSPELIAAKCATRAACAEGRLRIARTVIEGSTGNVRPDIKTIVEGIAKNAAHDVCLIDEMIAADAALVGFYNYKAMQSLWRAQDAAQRCADLLSEAGR